MGWEGAADIYDPIGLNISCFCAHLHLLVSISARLSLNEPRRHSRPPPPFLPLSSRVCFLFRISLLLFAAPLSYPLLSAPNDSSPRFAPLFSSASRIASRLVFRSISKSASTSTATRRVVRSFDRVEDLSKRTRAFACRAHATKQIPQGDG